MSGYMEVKTKYGKKTLVCLIPKKESKIGVTCHEKTLCDCEVIDLLNKLQKENQELKRKLDLAVGALEYYAETENWCETGYEDSRSKTEGDGGKHARQALKEIKGEE